MLDPVRNFCIVQLSTGYDLAATNLSLVTGDGAKLPDVTTEGAFNLVWYNSTDYSIPADDPDREIIRVTARTGDGLIVTRAQEGTTAVNHNIAGKTYKMILSLTRKTIDDIDDQLVASAGGSVDLNPINRMLANIEAVLDIDGRALQNSGKFYDLFDGTNNYSQGQLDIARTNLTNSVTAGATLLTVDSVVGFSVGREITIQDATNIERRVISAINGNIVTVPAITNSYAANTDVYRSLTAIGNVYDSLGGLATASYANKSYTAAQESTPYAVFFRPDGLRMFVTGINSNSVFQYNLSTAWDVTTATYQTNYGLSAQSITSAMGLWFNTDGTKMYVHDYGISRTYQYSLTTAWDVTTATYSSKYFTVSSYSGNCRSFCFSKDGTKIYYVRRGNAEIIQIPLSVAWDISTASYISPGVTKNFSSFGYEGGGVAFSSDGRSMYAMNRTASQVYLYKLTTAWDISTAVYSGKSFSFSSQTTTANCIFVNINRDKFYIVSETGQKVYQYNLGTLTTTCDIRYNITSLLGIKEIAAWIQRDKLTGFSISTAVSIVDNADNESYTVLTPTTTDLDASTAEEEYTYGISSPEEKATLRITMSRASIADNVKLIKLLGAID